MIVRTWRCWHVIAKLDYDYDFPHANVRGGSYGIVYRLRYLWSYAEVPLGVQFRMRHQRTARGWHVKVLSDRLYLTPVETVALQAVLGSDWRREAFNLVRTYNLPKAPGTWREPDGWNVLYRRKLRPLPAEGGNDNVELFEEQ